MSQKRFANQDHETKRKKSPPSPLAKAQLLLDEWLINPAKPEWIQLKILFSRFQDGFRPKHQDETKAQVQQRRVMTKIIAEKLRKNEKLSRTKFMRGYLELKAGGVPLVDLKYAFDQYPKDPKAAFQVLLDSLAGWDPRELPIPAKLWAPKYPEYHRGNILPTTKALVKEYGKEAIENAIKSEMERSNRPRKNCLLDVCKKFSTQDQLDRYKVVEDIRTKIRGEDDFVGRAGRQVQSIGRIDKLTKSKADELAEDLLLPFLVIRGMPFCHWCGDPPASDGTKDLGVDRLDASKTYEQSFLDGELLPSCWFCNALKSNLPVDVMFRTVINVVDYQDNNRPATITIKNRKHLLKWATFKTRAKRWNHPVELTEAEFLKLRDSPCYHCGIRGENGGGIDRLYNGPNYDKNSVASCHPCNKAKSDKSAEYFYDKCRKIVTHNKLI